MCVRVFIIDRPTDWNHHSQQPPTAEGKGSGGVVAVRRQARKGRVGDRGGSGWQETTSFTVVCVCACKEAFLLLCYVLLMTGRRIVCGVLLEAIY